MFRCLNRIGPKYIHAIGYRNVRGKISKTPSINIPQCVSSSSGGNGIRSFAVVSEPNDDNNQGNSSNDTRDKIATRWKREDRWDYMIEQLIEYKKEHGDTLVPSDYEHNQKLGTWVDNQRQNYRLFNAGKKSLLNEERIEQLETIGFVWHAHDATWAQNYSKLVEYKNKFGHCNVPKDDEEYTSLWMWTYYQKQMYNKRTLGKSHPMTDERIKALEDIGFVWSTTHDEAWNSHLEHLRKYKAYHGDCLVPKIYPSNPNLANWVDMQRTQYRLLKVGMPSYLNDERIASLEEIGFVWNVHDFKWQQRYEELQSFEMINGHCKVPYKGNSALYRWCCRQKAEYKNILEWGNARITEERIEKLRRIGLIK